MPLAVCATPIGNLDDVTLRVLAELRAADVVLAEDTRHTRILLERHGIAARLLSYHEHNEAARVAELLPRLAAGERVALVSDAGLPSISDPGARLVRAARGAGIEVSVLPGAFRRRDGARHERAGRARATSSSASCPGAPASSPRSGRNCRGGGGRPSPSSRRSGCRRRLRSLAAADPTREVAVCRELTKRFEEVATGSAAELAERFALPVKGEVTLVIGPAQVGEDRQPARDAVAELVAAGTPRRVAADVVARLTDTSRNDLYRTTL